MKSNVFLFVTVLLLLAFDTVAETGEKLWLRYATLDDSRKTEFVSTIETLVMNESGPVMMAAADEVQRACEGLIGTRLPKVSDLTKNALILVTSKSPLINKLNLADDVKDLGRESYIIKTIQVKGRHYMVVAGSSEAGVLYGTFELLRMIQTGASLKDVNVVEAPKYQLRVLNHWDNLDGTVERGYAGYSIWWNRTEPFDQLKRKYIDYARANASVGINGAVLNNVNANPQVLTDGYIRQFARIADVLRPYNIKVYMSINFSSPVILGGLQTSDPLNEKVIEWWKMKVAEIYKIIPDFGGFLVKANSEGQPGPQDFGRTHADGANMLARVLKPYEGVVMWRAFVYAAGHDDRAGQAYSEFVPLDSAFDDNVIIQVKNGPIDFQPREPFSPMFGAMQNASVMLEFQITQEYLGFSTHLAYLSTMWKETLDADTYAKGTGSTVAKATDGTLFNHTLSAIAGVSNIGRDVNWTGHHFAQANWYAFGRLSWNHQLSSDQIAREWVIQTFTEDPDFVDPVVEVMMRSREAVVNYMTPLGLHHLMGWNHHHGPEPWCTVEGARPDWLPSYYHRASEDGIGFDRSSTGSNSVNQYFSPVKDLYNNVSTCPENLLLWFHHLPWDYRMHNGQTLWNELVYKYYDGVGEVRYFQKEWDRLEGYVDHQRFSDVQYKLKLQTREAIWWRDACVLYFQTFSKRPIPAELERPIYDLEELKEIKFEMTNHN
ncbi:alpha-glucuronidase family glycosyl hydrolase [Geofilum sp. OHC36d9]|uniref:alpha-glucuronidase family glycosyl hydrolase n=1 Tax=Geofilum sp. OHC36d9 TaxID=3458413 RepID=UPI00403380B8